jgi:hypothetical protein
MSKPKQGETIPDKDTIAKLALNPGCNAAMVIKDYHKNFGEQSGASLINELKAGMEKLVTNDLTACEQMLFAQAHALEAIFTNFASRAVIQERMIHIDGLMKLALKAQNQCRMTLETLAYIKNPPVVYAKQANIAQGHQQINNGTSPPSHAEKIETVKNELLEAQHGKRLDCGAQAATGGTDKELATVDTLDRGKNP